MSNQLLEQYVRIHTAVTEYVAELRERMREQAGQTTVEWLVIMVGLIALAGALAASGIWTQVATKIGQTFSDLIGKVAGKST